jgi:2-hydroxychromene-2-carboxylate isomerase
MSDDRPIFYFDFNSPYAYLAAMRIEELIPGVEWRPVAFPIMLAQLGRLEEVLQRDFQRAVDIASERADRRGLPRLSPPKGFPVETWSLKPLRAAVFAAERGRVVEFCTAAFRKAWVESRSLADVETLRDAACEAGLDPAEVEEAVQRQEVKDRLKEQTEAALARGVTGIPTVEVGGELFWGDDHLEQAAAAARRLAPT